MKPFFKIYLKILKKYVLGTIYIVISATVSNLQPHTGLMLHDHCMLHVIVLLHVNCMRYIIKNKSIY